MNPDYNWLLILGVIGAALFVLGKGALVFLDLKDRVAGDPEPKHTPSIDTKIRTEVSESEKRTGAVIGEVKAELREDQRQHREEVKRDITHAHGRISGLRDEIKADYHGVETKVTESLEKMQAMYATTCERVGKCESDNAHQERQIIAQGSKLDRHIEKG